MTYKWNAMEVKLLANIKDSIRGSKYHTLSR